VVNGGLIVVGRCARLARPESNGWRSCNSISGLTKTPTEPGMNNFNDKANFIWSITPGAGQRGGHACFQAKGLIHTSPAAAP
jgi:hypothetical protein